MEVNILGHIVKEAEMKELPFGQLCVVDDPFGKGRELRLRIMRGVTSDSVFGCVEGKWKYVAEGNHTYANVRLVDKLDAREGNLL